MLSAADRYEGEWRNGLENGVGTFIAADGSTFNGPWANGKMHGQGVSLPPCPDKQATGIASDCFQDFAGCVWGMVL